MIRMRQCLMAAVVLLAGLVPAGTAKAGPLLEWLGFDHFPPPSYSPCHYWAPTAVRVKDCLHGVRLNVYAPDRHPEIKPTYAVLPFPCQTANPAATIIERPTPPAESAFRYLGGSTAPPSIGVNPPPSP